jgi:hypothetical protein
MQTESKRSSAVTINLTTLSVLSVHLQQVGYANEVLWADYRANEAAMC